MGRPSKYSKALADAICQALRMGNTRTAAYAYAGIDQNTFHRWMARFAPFREAVAKAEADAEVFCVAKIRQSINDGNTQDGKWWLERRRNQDWGRIDRVEVTLRREAERLADAYGLDADELLREAERIAAGAP